ncbi:MAG: PRC-barrel domain-containing protein [Acidimicrobiales bacterium]|nr:PRC-barrel domain-containing protein [Acidimicrobiales bacterium]MCB9395161.1 PRC-barrel domain-containing protein [Acidimicrobiaceae bacterium]
MHTTYTGHQVIDEHGEPVGTVSDVFYDDETSTEPTWLVVDPGVFRKERLVPIAGSYETDEGKIVVPFDRKWIKQAPVVDAHHYPDDAARQHAEQHFQIT